MCLDLNKDAKKQTASEDIVCYKRVLKTNRIHEPILYQYDKQSFTGIIKGIQCSGSIQVEGLKVYFCTNEFDLNGDRCIDALNYKYSWRFDNHIESIIINGVDVMIPLCDSIFMTPYQYAEVKLGETYTSNLINEANVINIGLHSFTTYEDARNDGHGIVMKCIIPKGAEYYLGDFCGDSSYASNQLKYLEIVTK